MNRKRRKTVIDAIERGNDMKVVALDLLRGGHLKIRVRRVADGVEALVYTGSSPSDHRALMNLRSSCRRHLNEVAE